MTFDWENFFKSERIEFVETGSNVACGHINIKCPFCGHKDPSHHMGVQTETGYWGCFRDGDHRGRKPHRLIAALTGWSRDKIAQVVGDNEDMMMGDVDFADLRARLKVDCVMQDQLLLTDPIEFTPDLMEITRHSRLTRKFFNYLYQVRGFTRRDVGGVVERYDLRGGVGGDHSGRLIFPVHSRKGMIGWTGRAVGKSHIRYKAHPPGSVVKKGLFNYQNAKNGGKVLALVEGSIDACKLDFYGYSVGCNAVAVMSTTVTPQQVALIMDLRKLHDRCVIVFDAGAQGQARSMMVKIPGLEAQLAPCPEHYEDPGDMPPEIISKFCLTL